MKVLYDHQIFDLQKIGGISRYFFELIQGNEFKDNISFTYTHNQYLINSRQKFKNLLTPQDMVPKDYFPTLQFKGKASINKLLRKINNDVKAPINNKKTSIEQIERGDFDVFHPTYYDTYFIDKISKPFVLTVYDLIHEIFPGYFNLNDQGFANKAELCDKAARILCISENTKKDLMTFYDVPEEKIDVIHLGNSLTDTDIENGKKLNNRLSPKYILFTGERRLYKNFYFFLEALAPILKSDSNLYLVCSGHPFQPAEINFFNRLGIADKIIHKFAKDNAALASLYSNAELFVFPSQYEGFGMPVLEAFACDCPAILSNTSSLPEIGGDGAAYFDPYRIESIRDCIFDVLYNDNKKEDLKIKGRNRLVEFSWEKTVTETRKVYKRI